MENNTNYPFKIWNGSPDYTGEQASKVSLSNEWPLYCAVSGNNYLRIPYLTRNIILFYSILDINDNLIYTETHHYDAIYVDLRKTNGIFKITVSGTEVIPI